MPISDFVGRRPARLPGPKEKKKVKLFPGQRDQRQARAILRRAGLGFGLTGPALHTYVEEKMLHIEQQLASA